MEAKALRAADAHFPSGAIVVRHETEADWLAYRSTRIGASTMAAVMGESPWASPYSVWCDRTLGAADDDGEVAERIRWGSWIERGIALG